LKTLALAFPGSCLGRLLILLVMWLLMGSTCVRHQEREVGSIKCRCGEDEQTFEFDRDTATETEEAKR